MELYSLEVFLTVVAERSFSRGAQKLYRTRPAISLALQRLEQEVGEKLIDRGPKDFTLTDAGHTVLEYARRFTNLRQEMGDALAELRDKSAGRLTTAPGLPDAARGRLVTITQCSPTFSIGS